MHVSAHLYSPLLVEGPFTVGTGAFNVQKPALRVRSTPTSLVKSEVRFLHDLRTFWSDRDREEWGETELFVLRNLPKSDVGFFETAGFYPDFLVWLKDGERQALAFEDPKGLARWNEEKVALLFGFIVTPMPAGVFSIPGVAPGEVPAYLASRDVLLQDRQDYVVDLLRPFRQSTALVSPGEACAVAGYRRSSVMPLVSLLGWRSATGWAGHLPESCRN